MPKSRQAGYASMGCATIFARLGTFFIWVGLTAIIRLPSKSLHLRLRGTESLNIAGKGGVSLLLAAMALAIFQAIFGLLPFVGGFAASLFSVGAVLCALYGWIRIQEDFLQRA